MPDFYFRDPRTFPAKFSEALVDAVEADSPRLLSTAKTEAEANRIMKEFRWWRWCIRESGVLSSRVAQIEHSYQIRLSKSLVADLWHIEVNPTLNRLTVILDHNPSLPAEIADYVNP